MKATPTMTQAEIRKWASDVLDSKYDSAHRDAGPPHGTAARYPACLPSCVRCRNAHRLYQRGEIAYSQQVEG